jgi:cytochrome bd-type quinol oxidase subunit 2
MGRNPIQVIVLALIAAACIYVVFKVAANWADWVVLGMIIVTAFGAAIAIYPRRYPAQKRAYTRRSDDKFRQP